MLCSEDPLSIRPAEPLLLRNEKPFLYQAYDIKDSNTASSFCSIFEQETPAPPIVLSITLLTSVWTPPTGDRFFDLNRDGLDNKIQINYLEEGGVQEMHGNFRNITTQYYLCISRRFHYSVGTGNLSHF